MRFILCLCLGFCLFLQTHVQAQTKEINDENLQALRLDMRTLAGVLHLYQRAGYGIVFSSNLVGDSLIVEHNPEPGEPIERLQEVLKWLNLSLQYQTETQSWFVVSNDTLFKTLNFSISDSISGLALSGASVSDAKLVDQKKKPVSNDKGLLTVTVDTKNLGCLRLQHVGYHDICVDFSSSVSPIAVTMTKAKVKIEEVIVTSQYHFDKKLAGSGQTFDALEIQSAPILADDALQIINSLPGIASQGFSAKPNVRGGVQDELLVVFDDIELIDPFHLKDYQSLLSGISPDLVDSISIYTGGYPVNYGGKMSGVMEIRSPIVPDVYAHSVSVSPFTTAIKTSGANTNESFAWIATARRGNLDESLELVNENLGIPHFSDFYLSTRWNLANDSQIETSYLALKDDVRLTSLDGDIGEEMRSIYNSQYGWMKVNFRSGDHIDNKFIVTVADIKNDRDGYINEPDTPTESVGELEDRRKFHLARVEFNSWYHPSSRHSFETGIKLEYLQGDYKYNIQTQRGELANLLGIPREVARDTEANPKGTAGATYLTYRYVPSDTWSFEGGMRADLQNYFIGERHQLSPRSAIKYAVNDNIHAKLNIGRFYQAPGINELNIESGQSEFHKPQKSDHYILGLVWELPHGYTFTAETYRKDVFYPRPRFENVFHPYVFIPDVAVDRVLITPRYAEIRGYEALLEYSNARGFRAWASFTRSDAKDELENNTDLSRPWNQKQSVQGGLTWAHRNWTFGTRLHWHSGWRTTHFPDYVADLDAPISYTLNDEELPDFFSLDMKLSYFWTRHRSQIEAFVEIINLTDNRNIGYYELEITENEALGGFNIEREANSLLPLIPSAGLSWRF